eukprot:scaffold1888_cov79-Isochrysis_galbana.AAC.2
MSRDAYSRQSTMASCRSASCRVHTRTAASTSSANKKKATASSYFCLCRTSPAWERKVVGEEVVELGVLHGPAQRHQRPLLAEGQVEERAGLGVFGRREGRLCGAVDRKQKCVAGWQPESSADGAQGGPRPVAKPVEAQVEQGGVAVRLKSPRDLYRAHAGGKVRGGGRLACNRRSPRGIVTLGLPCGEGAQHKAPPESVERAAGCRHCPVRRHQPAHPCQLRRVDACSGGNDCRRLNARQSGGSLRQRQRTGRPGHR